jgi:hypothetical protein
MVASQVHQFSSPCRRITNICCMEVLNFDGQCVFSDGDPLLQMLSTNTIHPVKHTHQYIKVVVLYIQ